MTREEAIKRIREWNLDTDDMEVLSVVIPELTENEDERVRKEMIEFLNQYKENGLRGIDIKPWIAYLEKQKERGTEEWSEVELTFRGEKVKVKRQFFRDDKGREYSTTEQDEDAAWYALRAWCEKKGISMYDLYPRKEWSEEDEKIAKEIEEELWYPGDFPDYPSKEESELYDDCQRRLNWFKNKLKSLRSVKQEWSEEDERNRDRALFYTHDYERTNGTIDGAEECISWHKSLPLNFKKKNEDVAKLCSNEWSEEDKNKLNQIIETLLADKEVARQENPQHYDVFCKVYDELISWLKSLRPQIIDSTPLYTIEQVDEKIREAQEWSEEDESRLDDIEKAISNYYDLNHAPQYHYWLEQKLKSIRHQPKQEWSEEDKKQFNIVLDSLRYAYEDLNNNKSFDTANIVKKAFDWMQYCFKSLHPQKLKVVGKPEWSEEDEKYLDYIIKYMTNYDFNQDEMGTLEEFHNLYYGAVNFLESIRPQLRWKPSEEQMNRLFSIVAALRKDYCNDMADFLANLYADLKKLI